jgi:hypothetical protein
LDLYFVFVMFYLYQIFQLNVTKNKMDGGRCILKLWYFL